jgi:Flp pilus assembly protein TadG
MLVILLAVAALSMELGLSMEVQNELQQSADSAVLAGAWE